MRLVLAIFIFVSSVSAWGDERASARTQIDPINRRQIRPTSVTASSDDFIIRSFAGGMSASELLDSCEQFRKDFEAHWMGADSSAPWRPRCEVVVHASRTSYQRAVGRDGGQTYGSSLIRFDRGQVALRRIDLLPNAEGCATALPHELAHVILADRFSGRQPPPWVDEGVATLTDSWEKRRLHHRDCQYALRAGTAFPLRELLTLERCASTEHVAAFYGQSLSFVSFLVERETPTRFLAMVELAMERGYEHALRATYGIEDLALLERQWREFAMTLQAPADAMLIQFAPLERASTRRGAADHAKQPTAAIAPQLADATKQRGND